MASHDPPPRKEVVEFQVNEDVQSVPDLLAMNNRVIPASEIEIKHPVCGAKEAMNNIVEPSQDDLLTLASEIEIKRPGCGAKEVLRLMLEEHPDWPITEERLHKNGLGAPPRDEYYGIKLVPARLLSINVAAHSFKMYFKLYIQVELKDEDVQKYISTKQQTKETKPLSADEMKVLDDCCFGDCTTKEGEKCNEQKKEKKEKLQKALNVCFSDCLNGKAKDEEGVLTPKPEIIFENRIGKVEVEKEVCSWKVVKLVRPEWKLGKLDTREYYSIVYQLHQNCTGEFSLSLQDRCGLWRMRNYPFDYYECCIDLLASRHTRSHDRASGKTEKKALSFKRLGVEWEPSDMNIELVSNEWSVWQLAACSSDSRSPSCETKTYTDKHTGDPYYLISETNKSNNENETTKSTWFPPQNHPSGAPMEHLYRDKDGHSHYQVSFGTTTAATALLFNDA
jgi:hypothetical protein